MPDNDSEFSRVVRDTVLRIDPANSQPPGRVIATLLAELKSLYPTLEIRQQDGLASFEVEPSTWYVYRDPRAYRHHDGDGLG